ncbi:MAG TPA: N-acetylmuramoyl-L-alanine amidase [Methylomirabilota bacterium]|nr:N-acetylmuramoyl-L-alanine amidase [Methylomirabilota bacterium]
MHVKTAIARPFIAALAAAMLFTAGAPMAARVQPGPVKVHASEVSQRVEGTRDFAIPSATTHIEVHWAGEPGAQLTAAFSSDGRSFSDPTAFVAEDADEAPDADPKADGETFGPLMGVDGITVVRIRADRPLKRVTLLALDASGPDVQPLGLGAEALGGTPIPGVISRAAWGADESIRFDGAGDERWPREYFPLQKLVVHHTAGRNADPNPAATVRAIYYFHAVTRRWGDIGYNYLIDEAGRVYEGRASRDYWNGTIPSSDNLGGLAVAGGHAKYHNQGTMGIALLGTFTTQAPTAAAQAALVRMLAWAAAKYHIDPRASGTYVNPQTGVSRYTANITGHRDYQSTTCPGGVLYALMPTIRSQVAAAMNLWPGQLYNPPRHLTFQAGTYIGYQFNGSGGITASKPYTLARASSAPTGGWATNPRGGSYWYVTAGVWAGYWVQGSARIVLDPSSPPTPVVEEFDTARPVTLPAGVRTGYRFNVFGSVTGSKALTLTGPTVIWATKRSGIPNQGGRWYYVTLGAWSGYWILETAGVTLGAAPPPYPKPIAIYDPPRTLQLAPGTYVGYQYSRYGILAGSYSHTLTAPSSAPTSRYSTLPGQTGKWYYIVDGIWESYWIRESSGTTLAPAPLGPM